MKNNIKNQYLRASVLTPLGTIAVLLFYLISFKNLGSITKNGLPSASFFPFLIFIAGMISATVLLISAIKEVKKEIKENHIVDKDKTERAKKDENGKIILNPNLKPIYITILTVIFIVLFKYLGYMITAPLYVFGFQVIYDDKLEKFKRKAIIAAIITILVYALYVGCFNILFPEVWS
ncbi:MAG: tripartite tricarboxylate transporter TctB family protein [Sphaerochaetaceae bacterium]|nr:tripartite tricarboxylate transporter TctB family protein [Sphaerochaetaceae bacterium]